MALVVHVDWGSVWSANPRDVMVAPPSVDPLKSIGRVVPFSRCSTCYFGVCHQKSRASGNLWKFKQLMPPQASGNESTLNLHKMTPFSCQFQIFWNQWKVLSLFRILLFWMRGHRIKRLATDSRKQFIQQLDAILREQLPVERFVRSRRTQKISDRTHQSLSDIVWLVWSI